MKIRNSIFTIIMIVLTVSSISTFYGIEQSSQKITAEITEKIEALSQNTMNEISKLMFERQADIKQLSDIRNPILHNTDISLESKIDYLRALEKSSKAFTSISLYDKNGVKIGNTRNIGIGSDDSDKPFFISAIKDQHYVDDIPVFSSVLNLNIIHFSGPLYDENGIPNGVIMAEFPLNKITSLINYNENLISETNFDLVSDDGIVIFSKDTRETAFSRSLNDISAFNMIKNSQRNVVSVIDDEQDALFVIVSQDKYLDYVGNNWYLFVSIPSEVALQEVNDYRTSSIITTLAVIVVGFIISILFSRSITTPIISLQKSFAKVMSGDLKVISDPKGSDEIRELHEYFYKMLIALQHVDKQKHEFLSMITHELKTPLTPITGWAEGLKDTKRFGELTEKQKMAVNSIYSNAIKLNRLIGDILDVQKLELNKMEFHNKPFGVDDMLKSICESYEPTFDSNSVKLVNNCKIHTVMYGDIHRLEQVLNNIINNSLDFISKDTGIVKINAIQKENSIIFTIEDNGIGISEENQKNLFKRFYQIDASLARKHGGTGLGLSICEGIVVKMGGKIWCESKLGQGTTFYFSIPIQKIPISNKKL